MSLQDGTYMIISANPESGHLDLSPYTIPIFPPVYFIVGSNNMDMKEQWKVASTANNTYTITSTTHSNAGWTLRGTEIVAGENKADEFSIEPAGSGIYTIRVPNNDQVATLDVAAGNKLFVNGQNGSDTQLWKFGPIDE